MMRRCLCVVVRPPPWGVRSFSPTPPRFDRPDGGDRRLHKFIREHQLPSARGGESRGRSASPGRAPDAADPSAPPPQSDWAGRLRRELYSETDPLAGLAHKDYYRDPALGYTPQYAPRDPHDGAVGYPRGDGTSSIRAASRRVALAHDVAQAAMAARRVRATARALSPAGRAALLSRALPDDRCRAMALPPENAALGVVAQLRASAVAPPHRQLTLDRYRLAMRGGGEGEAEGEKRGGEVGGSLPRAVLREQVMEQSTTRQDASVAEALYRSHGLRDRERWVFENQQRYGWQGFMGYDPDRFRAQQQGKAYRALQLPPSVPPSSLEEAQRALRSSALPPLEAHAQRAFARNTVTDRPKLGESLTATIMEEQRAGREAAQQQKEEARSRRFGLGRQGALVQDGGPDKRTLKKHTNDERLLHAMSFAVNAYRLTSTDEHVNPYVRGNTEGGVGHLLNNRFDIERREDRISRGEQDLTERRIVHYGVPIQQTVDEFVFRRRNARSERPIDYFKPFPSFRDHRLGWMYQDTEGFSLMKQRPDFLEWELFVRYRAHHQQRRELALQHGLEPLTNETAQERDARRLELDKLCEKTPFDPSRITVRGDEMEVDVETLRSWFGVYLLPSPTVVESVVGARGSIGLHIKHASDELGTADTREHVMSSRYFNQLLLDEGYAYRIARGFVREVMGSAKEVELKYEQPPEVLRRFSTEEQIMYQEYVRGENEKHRIKWEAMRQKRRYYTPRQQYAKIRAEGNTVAVIDVQDSEKGTVLTISAEKFAKQLEAALGESSVELSIPKKQKETAKGSIEIDGANYAILPWSQRRVVPLTVELESGELLETTDEEFGTYPLEVAANSEYNHALDYGIADYHYNRGNYIETQDVIWENATAEGVEGWSPATHVDGLRTGLPVHARRHVACSASTTASHPTLDNVRGDYQRGRIVEYLKQPFFNPEPRLVTVCFASDGAIEDVPLAELMIWQRRYHGPERTVGEESSRFNMARLNRYVDVADPNREKTRRGSQGGDAKEHFLEKYMSHAHSESDAKYRTTKQITEIDTWDRFDTRRPENYRPLSISHRRDYVRMGYFPRFTPWEWITVQEADQPLIHETLRQDNIGTSYFFSLNRYWRYKARPHGYLRNYDSEIRDLIQFVDGVTPWRQAQKIRTYWEVRQHHPMPQFNRPEVALHRNTMALLPAHLWETDKKTGKVKALKDSVRDYQTQTPLPKWVEL